MPNALVIRAPGTNCDAEMCRAFELAGARVTLLHIDRLIADPARIEAFELLGFPGGFSYGDDIASGRVLAMKARERLFPHLRAAVVRGCAVIGACNGFQVLVQVGLLPGPLGGEAWTDATQPEQTCSLSENIAGRFCDRWVGMEYEPSSVCVWTRGLAEGPVIRTPKGEDSRLDSATLRTINQLPVAHGEGRFTTLTPSVTRDLERAGQVAVRYTDNYNGSEGAIAGICDSTGRVFGLMPHPERYLDWTRHPYWTRLPASLKSLETPGLRMFRNAVEAVAHAPV
ncbi:MAG: phosphoribosylformylglycinamidine synthase subunit PurQ [Phycisphaerales bacterium]